MFCAARFAGERGGVLRETLYDYCLKHDRAELLSQWHAAKNEPLTPESVTYGSKKKVWWRCERGHEWPAVVYTRTGGRVGCPYCTGKAVLKGEHDLRSENPELAAQWHPTKNTDLTPDCVAAHSHRRVWWRCEQGHEWLASINSRSNGTGCPVCARRTILPGENDLATTHPELARQWHPTKNGGLTPRDVVAGTRRKSWWICEKKHEWYASIASRAAGTGCPVCAGKAVIPGENDLTSAYPELAEQWHPSKNGPLTPKQVSVYSNREVWWLCHLGHAYLCCTETSSFPEYGRGRMGVRAMNTTRDSPVVAGGVISPSD